MSVLLSSDLNISEQNGEIVRNHNHLKVMLSWASDFLIEHLTLITLSNDHAASPHCASAAAFAAASFDAFFSPKEFSTVAANGASATETAVRNYLFVPTKQLKGPLTHLRTAASRRLQQYTNGSWGKCVQWGVACDIEANADVQICAWRAIMRCPDMRHTLPLRTFSNT